MLERKELFALEIFARRMSGVSTQPRPMLQTIFEPPQKAIPPAKRFYGYVRKQAHEVFVVMEGMEIRGVLHTTGDLDLRRVITTSGESFLPLTKAVVTLDANERYVIEQEAIMINANLIRYIAKYEVRNTPTPTPISRLQSIKQ